MTNRADFRDGVAVGVLLGLGAAIAITGLLLASGGCFTEGMGSGSTSTESTGGSSSTGESTGTDSTGAPMCAGESEPCAAHADCCAGLACVDWYAVQECADVTPGSSSESTSTEGTGGSSSTDESTSTGSSSSESTGAAVSDCCIEHAGTGCSDPVIEDAVCDSLPECCAVGPWGWACANQATNTGLCS